jgi:hypothetical protein
MDRGSMQDLLEGDEPGKLLTTHCAAHKQWLSSTGQIKW